MSLRIATHAAVAVALAATATTLFAGPLTPPAGPVAPTPGPEPRIAINATNTPGDFNSIFRITQPGSYYLTGNINGVTGKHGIEIAASGVTIDLNGFDLVGLPALGTFDGITAGIANLKNITIRNGSVRDWGDDGVDLRGFVATIATLSDLRVSGNTGDGFAVHDETSFTNCIAISNGANGFLINESSIIRDCVATRNTGSGFQTESGCSISASIANQNVADGFNLGIGNTITSCSAYLNGGDGIQTSTNAVVSACTVYSNTLNGISTSNGSNISGCAARFNVLDGIRVASQCIVINNTCTANGNLAGDGAGIHALGADNRIEANNCAASYRGIDIDSGGNIVIRNSCTSNTTNWVIAANNVVGPILDRTAPGSAAISGNSAPDSTGSSHPNANFSY
jgi:hypothetical protein